MHHGCEENGARSYGLWNVWDPAHLRAARAGMAQRRRSSPRSSPCLTCLRRLTPRAPRAMVERERARERSRFGARNLARGDGVGGWEGQADPDRFTGPRSWRKA